MIKFIHPADDKLMILDGLSPKFLGQDRRQLPYDDSPFDKTASEDWMLYRQVEYHTPNFFTDAHEESAGRTIGGIKCGVAGKFLNNNTVCSIGRYAYTHFCGGELYYANDPSYPYLMQWDIKDRNVAKQSGIYNGNNEVTLSYPALNGRNILGRGWREKWEYRFWDPGLIEYHGNLVMVAVTEGWYGKGIKDESDKRFCAINRINYSNITDDNNYYFTSLMFCPNERNGSGVLVSNAFNGSGHVESKSWWDDVKQPGMEKLTWNITSVVDYNDYIYAATPSYVFKFKPSGQSDGNIIYSTNGSYFMPSPKWFEKHNGNLYMLEASGTLKQVVPSGNNTIFSNVYNFSYIEPFNLKWGPLYVGEQGYVRATKSDIKSYKDNLHVFLQIGSGTYYFSSSGSLDTWVDRTNELPEIFTQQEGNIYSYRDDVANKLYIFYNTMSRYGLAGLRNWGDKETGNIFHMYEYDDSTWTYKGWFTDSTRQSNGGFIPYNDKGPHVEMPSGSYYPRGFADTGAVDPSGNIVNKSIYKKLRYTNRSSEVVTNTNKFASSLASDGRFLYAGMLKSLYVYELSSDETYPYDNLNLVDSYYINKETRDIEYDDDNYIYVATDGSGISTFHVDSSGNISQNRTFDTTDGDHTDMVIDDNYLYVATKTNGIKTYSYNSGVLTHVDTKAMPGFLNFLQKDGEILYESRNANFFNEGQGFGTYKISNSGTLSQIDSISDISFMEFTKFRDYVYCKYFDGSDWNIARIDLGTSGVIQSMTNIYNQVSEEYTEKSSSVYDISLIEHDDYFVYFSFYNSIYAYLVDASGNLSLQWDLPRYYGESINDSDGAGALKDILLPSGTFDARYDNFIYRLKEGNTKGEYAGIFLSNVYFTFSPKSDTTVTPYFFVCNDFATIDYKLFHEDKSTASVKIEYSLDDGCTWDECIRKKDYRTQQLLGEPKDNISASPSGEWHTFYWDFVGDLGYNINESNCRIRITPYYS